MSCYPVVEHLNATVPAEINIVFQKQGARPHANDIFLEVVQQYI